MASSSSKAMPYAVLLTAIGMVAGEAYYDIEIDLDTLIPVLIPLGLGGAGLSAVKSISAAKTAVASNDTKKIIAEEMRKIKNKAPVENG